MGATLVCIFSTLRPEQFEDQVPSMSTGCFSFRYKSGLIFSLILTFMECKISNSNSNVNELYLFDIVRFCVFSVKSVRSFDFQAFGHSHLLDWFVWGLEA